jgi:hypothetical protein
MAFVGTDQLVEVVISDNSGDDEKEKYITGAYGDRVKYIHCPGISAADNVSSAMLGTSGEFIMMCADDDVIVKMSPLFPHRDDISEKTVVIRPTIALYDRSRGVTRFDAFDIVGGNARSRVDRYFSLHGLKNTTYYSFVRRDVAIESLRLATLHPLSASGYYDWAMVISYVAFGDLIAENRMIYAYDESKWSDAESSGTSLLSAFKAAGFGPHTADFLWFLVAIDSFLFICRRGSPLARMEALEAGVAAFSFYLEMFLRGYETSRHLFSAEEQREISRIASIVDVRSALDVALGIIDTHNAALGRKYREFYREAIGSEWGEFA